MKYGIGISAVSKVFTNFINNPFLVLFKN